MYYDKDQADFIGIFNTIQARAHAVARQKGFWDKPRSDGDLMVLMISEICEGFEALRAGNIRDDKIPEFLGIEAELADTVIRIIDYAQGKGLRVAEALIAKMEMNKTREYKHGKQF